MLFRFILDGCSFYYAQIWSKSGISIWWRHLVTSKELSNLIFFRKIPFFTSCVRNVFRATILYKNHWYLESCVVQTARKIKKNLELHNNFHFYPSTRFSLIYFSYTYIIQSIIQFIHTGWPRSYCKYILQIPQPSQYRYAKLQYKFAVTSGPLSKWL